MAKDTHTSQDLLNDAIRAVSGDSSSSLREAARPVTKMTLEEVLQEHHAHPETTRVLRPTRAATATPQRAAKEPLASALAKLSHGEMASPSGRAPVSSAASSTVRSAKSEQAPDFAKSSIGESLASASPALPAAAELAGPRSSHRMTIAAVALALTVALAGIAWWQHQQSSPAAVLQNLGAAVEQHRLSNNGQLPKSLSALPVFPPGAVEWPLRYWNARDGAGRTEIIWATSGNSHYTIVLRQGKETWRYSDRDGAAKPLFSKGNP